MIQSTTISCSYGDYEWTIGEAVNYIKHRTHGEGYIKVTNDKMIIKGDVVWKKEVKCEDNEQAGFAISIIAPKENNQEFQLWDTDGFSGLKDGKIVFSGWNDSTGWKSEWACSIESFVKCFATRVKDAETVQFPTSPKVKK